MADNCPQPVGLLLKTAERKVSETLRMMGRPADERIIMDTGRELCLRTGSKALLGGTISSLGSHYLIDLSAVACNTGDSLAKEPGEATSKEDVLKALSRASLTLARIGDAPRAKVLAGELEKNYPANTILKLYWLPTIKAAIELNKGNPAQAVVYLEAAAPYELGEPPPLQIGLLYPAYVRGQAHLLAHNGTAAAAESQKLLDHRGIVVNFVTGSLAHLQIGRAYEMAGDTAKAKAAYQDFFNIWKNADPDIPILKQAKAEYAELQ
jgi:hypothetical protein